MEHKLRIEQVEAGNRYLRMVLGGDPYLDAVEMAQLSTHLQYAAPEYADPTEKEIEEVWYAQGMLHRHEIGELLSKFVEFRRASLLRPVVPALEEEIHEAVNKYAGMAAVDKIIAIYARRAGGSHE